MDAGLGFRRDTGIIETASDAGVADSGPQTTDLVLRRGQWSGRSDYRASGQAELIRRPDGTVAVQFSEDFSVSRVPGPVVVLSYRSSLGRSIDPVAGDIELARLTTENGAQIYEVPGAVDDRDFVWVYCEPFGLEVGRAPLEVVP